MNKTGSQFGGDNDDAKSSRSKKSAKSNKKSSMDVVSKGPSSMMNKTGIDLNFKLALPMTCHVSMIKKLLIEKMPAKYFLASHPFPKIEGEMLIFRP